MSAWEEIVRLQQDLERVQAAGAVQRLSERNCVEIVQKLLEMQLLEILFTTDGKEYVTPSHLGTEIKDELYMCGGRVSLVQLASNLSIDYSHVEAAAQGVAGGDTHLVLGQLVSADYMEELCRQVNERLQQQGTISLPSLTKEFDLPTDFLIEQVHARLGSIIEGFKDDTDPKVLLTPGHVARVRAKVRGVLSGVTVPTTTASIISRFGFQEKLFFSLAEELIRTGRLAGQITGGRSAAKASYVPHSYARAQQKWVDSFLSSNGYLEYDAVTRLGISDPKQYIKKRFPDSGLVFLTSCCISGSIVEQMEVAVEEALNSGSWVDILPLLPSVLGPEDARQLVQTTLANRSSSPSSGGALLLADCCVLSRSLVSGIVGSQEAGMDARAQKDVESGAVAQSLVDQGADGVEEVVRDKKEERRKKAAGGSAGGGAQGRQTKTKSTKDKKKGGRRKDDDWSDDEDGQQGGGKGGGGKAGKGGKGNAGRVEMVWKSLEALEEDLRGQESLADCPDEVYAELAEQLVEQLDRRYREVARERFQSSLASSLQNKRRSHTELGDKVNSLLTTIRLGEKALGEFENEDTRAALSRHLLKEAGLEMVNEMFLYVAEENMVKVEEGKELSTEARVKIIGQLPKEISEPALKVHKAVLGASVADFLSVLDDCVAPLCDVMLKKADKKKDRQLLFGHRQSLLEKMQSEQDPALVLHLAVLCLFHHVYGAMLQASGKFVPVIIEHLSKQGGLSVEQVEILSRQQKLVVAGLGGGNEEVAADLQDSTPRVKALVEGFKKSSSHE